MKILIATDKFKGSLTALEACNAVKEGILKVIPSAQVDMLPLADGGDGTLETIESKLHFKRIYLDVTGPLFRKVGAWYGLQDDTAYIEMASASGLLLLREEEQHAPSATTLGTGEMIVDALHRGARKIYLFVGGSATNDCGLGVAQALGYRFFDKNSNELSPVGASLEKIVSIGGKANPDVANTEFVLVTDVENPLYGTNGAAHVFARQKGANPEEIEMLDRGLRHFSELIKQEWKFDVANIPGAGAAGGLGAGAMIFLKAKPRKGITTIMEILHFDKLLQEADMLISGEGKFDQQTLEGKVVKGTMERALQFKKPFGVVCGICELKSDEINELPVVAVEAIKNEETSFEDAMQHAYALLVTRTEQLVGKMLKS
ncbi:glycerate kinase [Prolixibacter denitrificans]|uniref:Glycerate kinase n=1 Tax=Prolixibacter denitrificans TaxID=1541063 RepID=A0A2P8CE20_9BACT|nr:glycerate kinase [Prolixibacter denitrificans]PSK83211.1 glycerate kinase [Prolixibacter denitrificans]GET21906.1 glycerate kinase [Prolixibacter denitrificans]